MKYDFLLIGHRGGGKTDSNPKGIKENTKESFKYAFQSGVDYCETDLHLTRDNKIVLYHDWHYDGIHLSKIDYESLLKKEPELITLHELVETFPDKKFIFELKYEDVDLPLISQIFETQQEIINNPDKYRFISFSLELLKKIKTVNENLYCSWIVTKSENRKYHFFLTKKDIEMAIEVGVDEISGHVISISKTKAKLLHSHKIKVGLGPINSKIKIKRAVQIKCDVIYSDKVSIFNQ